MGAAPSREVLATAPFRTPYGGARQIALIPCTPEFFPSPDCPLFQQLYDARMDPSVRYYMRNENGDRRQDRIPAVQYTREELYKMYATSIDRIPIFDTNEELRQAVLQGTAGDVRPVACAVVFLYDGATHVPEGSIRLTRDRDTFVKVIGGIGDAHSMLSDAGLSNECHHVQMFITKSAGDHNMGRVCLLATYVYHHQCVDIVGLPEAPVKPVTFLNLKTNIPFLCFLRELRDRTRADLVAPPQPTMWLEDDYVRGFIPKSFARQVCRVFASHFLAFVESKANQRAAKQLRRLCNMANLNSSGVGSVGAGSSGTGQTATQAAGGAGQEVGTAAAGSSGTGDAYGEFPGTAPKAKITYVVRGYITSSEATLVAESYEPNEVYVACCDARVRVIPSPSVSANASGTTTDGSAPAKGQSSDRTVPATVASLTVGVSEVPYVCKDAQRTADEEYANFLSGSKAPSPTPDPPRSPEKVSSPASAAPAAPGADATESPESGAAAAVASPTCTVLHVRRGEILSYCNAPQSTRLAPVSVSDSAACTTGGPAEGKESAAEASGAARDAREPTNGERPLSGGTWRVDPSVYIENVLLSLVRDECRSAREADVDDPRWVRDEARSCAVHDESFYIWRFRRGKEVFYYGTVPKFANPNRRRTGGAAAANLAGANASGSTGMPAKMGTFPSTGSATSLVGLGGIQLVQTKGFPTAGGQNQFGDSITSPGFNASTSRHNPMGVSDTSPPLYTLPATPSAPGGMALPPMYLASGTGGPVFSMSPIQQPQAQYQAYQLTPQAHAYAHAEGTGAAGSPPPYLGGVGGAVHGYPVMSHTPPALGAHAQQLRPTTSGPGPQYHPHAAREFQARHDLKVATAPSLPAVLPVNFSSSITSHGSNSPLGASASAHQQTAFMQQASTDTPLQPQPQQQQQQQQQQTQQIVVLDGNGQPQVVTILSPSMRPQSPPSHTQHAPPQAVSYVIVDGQLHPVYHQQSQPQPHQQFQQFQHFQQQQQQQQQQLQLQLQQQLQMQSLLQSFGMPPSNHNGSADISTNSVPSPNKAAVNTPHPAGGFSYVLGGQSGHRGSVVADSYAMSPAGMGAITDSSSQRASPHQQLMAPHLLLPQQQQQQQSAISSAPNSPEYPGWGKYTYNIGGGGLPSQANAF